jgi:hypothetical protein
MLASLRQQFVLELEPAKRRQRRPQRQLEHLLARLSICAPAPLIIAISSMIKMLITATKTIPSIKVRLEAAYKEHKLIAICV